MFQRSINHKISKWGFRFVKVMFAAFIISCVFCIVPMKCSEISANNINNGLPNEEIQEKKIIEGFNESILSKNIFSESKMNTYTSMSNEDFSKIFLGFTDEHNREYYEILFKSFNKDDWSYARMMIYLRAPGQTWACDTSSEAELLGNYMRWKSDLANKLWGIKFRVSKMTLSEFFIENIYQYKQYGDLNVVLSNVDAEKIITYSDFSKFIEKYGDMKSEELKLLKVKSNAVYDFMTKYLYF